MPSTEARPKDCKKLGSHTWYHGTTMQHYNNIKQKGVSANINVGLELDFGYGFYMTPERNQAEKYIKDRVKGSHLDSLGLKAIPTDKTPVVVEFGFLASYDERFAEFVFHNRYHNVYGESHHTFDIIYGVMSDSIPTILIQQYKSGEINKEDVIENLKKKHKC